MARVLTLVFAALVLGAAAAVGSMLFGGPASGPIIGPLLSPITEQLSPPLGPVDATDSSTQVFTVQPGATAAQIGEQMQQRNLILSSVGFRRVVDAKGVGAQLAAGDYEVSRSMSTEQIVDLIASGQVKRGLIATIPEGWRAEQIADRLESVGFAPREEFLRAVADPRSIPGLENLLGELPPTLEGYLFPWTYEVKEPVSGTQAAEQMVRLFAERQLPELRRGAASVGLTPREVIVLASVVEREAQQAAERPTIAGVYLNRLERGMPLQADPTVQYAVANRDLRAAAAYGYWKRDLTVPDLQLDSPYNTYVRDGLPPGPICNPGEASLRAVLQPERTDYLYFVARGDGSHLFARTLAEHNQNVERAKP